MTNKVAHNQPNISQPLTRRRIVFQVAQLPVIIRPDATRQSPAPVKPPHPGVKPPGVLRPQTVPRLNPVHIRYQQPRQTPEQASAVRRLRGRGIGRVLVIVGNGPSVNEAPLQKLLGCSGIDLMSINQPDPRVWPTPLWAFCDPSQHKRHIDLWSNYDGTIINSSSIPQQRPGTVQVQSLNGPGFSRDLTRGFYIGRSTVYANLQTAHWMQYDHVYCFGVDMNKDGINGQLWFYGVNPDAPIVQRKDRFKLEAEHYQHAAGELSDDERAKYTFCSTYNPWPFVSRFNQLDHRTAVQTILSRHGDSTNG